MGIDTSRAFIPLRIVILTISDTRTDKNDKSGTYLTEAIGEAGHQLIEKEIIKDELEEIAISLSEYSDRKDVDAIICTGGTGLTRRDVTPEAFHRVIDKEIPGFGELFRFLSYKNIGVSTIQSRATAGTRGACLLFALPGSTGACRDGWEEILKFQLDIRFRPCNFAEILPRMGSGNRGKSL